MRLKHVRGKRAVGGGAWYFNLCAGSKANWGRFPKYTIGRFVAPAYTTCKKCIKICERIFGAPLVADTKPDPKA